MNVISGDLFRAIHEGKWLYISYENMNNSISKFWIGIKDIDVHKNQIIVDGIHITNRENTELRLFVDKIVSSSIIEGTYMEINEKLVDEIHNNPHKYVKIFKNVLNLRILSYLHECNRMDSTPYKCQYTLVEYLDGDRISNEQYILSDEQYTQITEYFKLNNDDGSDNKKTVKQLALNMMSVVSDKGLYVLAYKKINIDLGKKKLKLDNEITLCRAFSVDGEHTLISAFLESSDLPLLDDFADNQETIKDLITQNNKHVLGVDDLPYLVGIGMDSVVDLHSEFSKIVEMYNDNTVTFPIKAFFGDLVKKPEGKELYHFALLSKQLNLDQLVAINNAMKYPLTYVQGPPGTGKTTTITNSILTAYFNGKTVLFTSYNNHPIDGVLESLQNIHYKTMKIPFPVFRHGNNEVLKKSLMDAVTIYERTKNVNIYESTLKKNRKKEIEKTKKLRELLHRYEEILDLNERKDAAEVIIESECHLNLFMELSTNQVPLIEKKLEAIGAVTDEDALSLIDDDMTDLRKYLNFTAIENIKRLGEDKNNELKQILYIEDEDKKVKEFNKYISEKENLMKFMEIFPVVISTCLSAAKLSEPTPHFDLVIIDEASQCNNAVSLIPIIRGKGLMLVGDPQQLQPVVLLDDHANQVLRKKYNVIDEYDYLRNSIYKTYLAIDSISDEVLLSNHYRSHPKIIEFCNKKYYRGKLKIKSTVESDKPLQLIAVKCNSNEEKNVSYAEAEEIINYVRTHQGESIGIITPFTKQKGVISELLEKNGFSNVPCGTVHAFQGDEKDTIIFSLSLSDRTHEKTYNWLRNNKELINVATSRAKKELIIIADYSQLERLHKNNDEDDLFELVEYVRSNGETQVREKSSTSRALGIKPYSTATEEAFLQTLNHAVSNIITSGKKYSIEKEVAISHVFNQNTTNSDLFYSGRFDFVVYEKAGKSKLPVLAIELDGKEHYDQEVVKRRDIKKREICDAHNLQLIRIDNSYARRYQHIKEILSAYFDGR